MIKSSAHPLQFVVSLVLATLLAPAALATHKDGAAHGPQGRGGGQPAQVRNLDRYQLANQCWAIYSYASERYLVADGAGFTAGAESASDAEPFYLKPTALGKYMLFPTSRQLLAITGDGVGGMATTEANDTVEWTMLAVGDTTEYPPTPRYNTEPEEGEVAAYLAFRDPNIHSRQFSISSTAIPEMQLAVNGDGALDVSDGTDNPGFGFVPAQACAHFPEAESNFSGTPFSGTREDGSVLGHVDAHVHISATEFLGGAEHGHPYHKFGVEHALSDCLERHGPQGALDVVGNFYGGDYDGHSTVGYPLFEEWPARDKLTHEAIYWRWIERAWAAGLRIIVNDLVENETLCELVRQISTGPMRDCDPMNSAGRQAGSMYGMMDYIDAQYGGRGKGFFQIVHNSKDARKVIEDGKIAVILGIEISNLFNCKVYYTPNQTRKEPFEEPMPGDADYGGPDQNRYGCTKEHMLAQMDRVWNRWGVRQIITIHEFDNAFGGNGIFDGLLLNLGNRENSGALPSGDLARVFNLMNADPENGANQVAGMLERADSLETPTGEWWTTYNCPIEGETEGFSGYLWSNSGGSSQSYLSKPMCAPMGQGGRWGGPTPCYPSGEAATLAGELDGSDYGQPEHSFRKYWSMFAENYPDDPSAYYVEPEFSPIRQCNARWMTPMGFFAYTNIMQHGFIFDWDHLAMGMKTQLLDLAETQNPPYPLVSTHGTFGGTTIEQARRLLADGGVLYPSNGSSAGFVKDMDETFGVHAESGSSHLFGFGYGTDTNGLSGQSSPRGKDPANPIVYQFKMYSGGNWDQDVFDGVAPITFAQPSSTDAEGKEVRVWHEDVDGNAHYGMLSDFIQEIALDGRKEHLVHLYNSAEVYLRMWELTERSSANFSLEAAEAARDKVLRPAPSPTNGVPPAK